MYNIPTIIQSVKIVKTCEQLGPIKLIAPRKIFSIPMSQYVPDRLLISITCI